MSDNHAQLSFSVTGSFVTRTSREWFYTGNDLPKAIDLLMSCLVTDELTDEQRLVLALDILAGKKDVVGTYPGPDYGVVDVEKPDERYGVKKKLEEMRDTINSQQEEVSDLLDKLTFICEQLSDEQKADINEEWLAYNGEGHIFEIPEDQGVTPVDYLLADAFMIMSDSGESKKTENRPTSMKGMLQSVLDRMKNGRDDDYGWLAPNGDFYAVEWGEHQGWAERHLRDHPDIYTDWDEDDYILSETVAGDYLTKRGWILFHNPSQGMAYLTRDDTCHMTRAQREFVYDYYTKRNRPDLAAQYFQTGD